MYIKSLPIIARIIVAKLSGTTGVVGISVVVVVGAGVVGFGALGTLVPTAIQP